MTPTELRDWRIARRLTQDQLAAYLPELTRDRVANMELGRTSIPDAMMAHLNALIPAPAATAIPPAAHVRRKGRVDPALDKRTYYSLTGERVNGIYVAALKENQGFYKVNWTDDNGHPMANLYLAGKQGKRHCTPIRVDTVTWWARIDFMRDMVKPETIDQLNAMLAPKRASFESAPMADPMAAAPQFPDNLFSTAK